MGNIVIPEKKGWHYLWTYKEERELGEAPFKYTATVPVSAHVERVYKQKDFALLGIVPIPSAG